MRETKIHHRRDHRGRRGVFYFKINIFSAISANSAVIEKLLPIHQAQLMSYLKLSNCNVGLLINFNVKILKNGIQRVVNNFPDSQRTLRPLR